MKRRSMHALPERDADHEVVAPLPAVEAVDALASETLPGFLAQLAALQARVAARIASPFLTREAPREQDMLLTVKQAAARLGVSPDWLYRRAATLPFTRPLSPRALRFSATGIDRWLRQQSR